MKPILIHRGNTYKTASNRRKIVKSKSGCLKSIKIGKRSNVHKCHGCEKPMTSIIACKTAKFSRQKVSQRRVARPYGSTHCGKCVEKKIILSFLETESKTLKGKSE